jgi:hypothetical protein
MCPTSERNWHGYSTMQKGKQEHSRGLVSKLYYINYYPRLASHKCSWTIPKFRIHCTFSRLSFLVFVENVGMSIQFSSSWSCYHIFWNGKHLHFLCSSGYHGKIFNTDRFHSFFLGVQILRWLLPIDTEVLGATTEQAHMDMIMWHNFHRTMHLFSRYVRVKFCRRNEG